LLEFELRREKGSPEKWRVMRRIEWPIMGQRKIRFGLRSGVALQPLVGTPSHAISSGVQSFNSELLEYEYIPLYSSSPKAPSIFKFSANCFKASTRGSD
jgi:hypothetical protein